MAKLSLKEALEANELRRVCRGPSPRGVPKHTKLYVRTDDGVLLNEYPELHDIFRATVDEEMGL